MRKTVIALGVIGAIGASTYGYYRYTRKAPAPSVATAKITRGDVADTVGATGQLQAVTTVQVGTQVSGTILALNADFNSIVRKGQVLARLDPSLFETQIEQARANLARAEADLERLRVSSDDSRNKLRRAQELSEKKLIAVTDLEAAQVAVRSADAQLRSQQAAVAQAQASLSQNQVNLQHTVIEAPIDGLVISRNVDVGQTVAASMSAPTLFLLAADLTKMQVIASLDESDVGRIRPGQRVLFRVDAYPTEEFIGEVTQVRLQPTTVQNVVTYATVISVPNPGLQLKPGMTANVNIEIARRNNSLRVPNAALRFRPTNEIFTAFGQTPPPPPAGGPGGRGGRRGGNLGPDTQTEQPSQKPATVATNDNTAAPARPAAQPTRPAQGSQAAAEPPRETANAAGAAPAATATEGGQRRSGRGRGAGSGDDSTSSASPASPASPDASGGRSGGFDGGGLGRGGGRGGNFQERLAGLSPEERDQMLERMRARGFSPPPEAQGTEVPRGGRAGGTGGTNRTGQGSPSPQPPQPAQGRASRTSAATTIDALFGPLPVTESMGQVWLHENGKLTRVRLRLGISDGQQTELIQVLDGGSLNEGADIVTNVTIGAQRATATTGNAFPGLGQQRGGFQGDFRGGGFPGGGGGGGRGGR